MYSIDDGKEIIVVLADFKKTFELIDCYILLNKLEIYRRKRLYPCLRQIYYSFNKQY